MDNVDALKESIHIVDQDDNNAIEVIGNELSEHGTMCMSCIQFLHMFMHVIYLTD